MLNTVLDYLRVATAVAFGCGLYDAVLMAIVKFNHNKNVKAIEAEHADIVKRIAELKAAAEEATKKP